MSQNELREVVVATANRGKVVEIAFILGDLPFRVRGLSPDESVLFPEEGIDYEANAIAKAEVVSSRLGCVAVADDSGLEVDALGGAPGPLSARYGGEGLNDVARVGVLLDALREVAWQDRGARFVCVAALAAPGWPTFKARGACAGRILESPQGRGGFGYDPVFRPDGYELAMAELSQAEKNRISHRGRAFETVGQELRRRVHRHGRV